MSDVAPAVLRWVVPTLAFVAGAISTAPAAAQGGPPASPVRVDAVRLQEVQERRRVTGELRAVRRSRVASREPGVVVELPVIEGSRVKQGDTLCTLDSEVAEILLGEAEAQVDLARAVLRERAAQLEQFQNDLRAIQDAADRGAANPKELLDAESFVSSAEARHAQALGSLAVAQARVRLLRKRVDDARITAPFDGVVLRRAIEIGQWVGEGDPVVEMISTGTIEAWIDVPQEYAAALIALGKPDLSARVEATGEMLELDRSRVVPAVDASARTFPIVAMLDDRGVLAPGMSITAWVPIGVQGERLTVHRDAVNRGLTGPYVYAVRGGEGPTMAAPAFIEILFDVGERVVVAGPDLRPGDAVVVEGNARLFPGAPIRVVEMIAPGVGSGAGPGADPGAGPGAGSGSGAGASTGASGGPGAGGDTGGGS